MKRLITIIMILAMILPAAACSEIAMDNHPESFVGCWASFIPYSSNLYGDQTIVISLNHDGTFAAVILGNNAKEKKVMMQSFTGQWTVISDTVVYQRDGKDKYGMWNYENEMIWFTLSGARFGLKKIPIIDITQVVYPDMSEETDVE